MTSSAETEVASAWAAFCQVEQSHAGVKALRDQSRTRRLDKGESLIEQDGEDQTVFLIASGTLKIVRYSRNGHEIWLAGATAGHLVGEIAALSGKARTSSAIATDEVFAIGISGAAFLGVLAEHGAVSTALSRVLAKRLAATSSQMVELIALPVTARLHAELVRIGEEDPEDEELFHVQEAPTVSALAQRIHATREAASRAMTQLERHRLVLREGAGIRVIAPDTI